MNQHLYRLGRPKSRRPQAVLQTVTLFYIHCDMQVCVTRKLIGMNLLLYTVEGKLSKKAIAVIRD
jgi:hypothetical protein